MTALIITLGVSYVIFDSCNEKFINEAGDKLTNVAYLLAESIDKEYISSINSPEEYNTEEYKKLDEDVNYVLDSKVNAENYLYCVIYKVYNDVVCEVYRDDMLHGVMYPMAGRYANSIEEYIAEENDYDVCYEFALSEGTYMYALIPVYDEEGETIAFIETGMDYTTFSAANNELYVKVLMLAVMAVIIVMLLFTETLHTATAIRVKKEGKKKNGICMPELIRPISFLFFMIANMSTAFLPIYGMNLWNDSFPMQAEMAAALPISAELIVAAITAFLCGFIVQKLGIKLICILGAGFYVVGNIMSAFAPNLWILISANAVCGIGSGFLTIALNSWAASYEEESLQNKGFIHINAAYLAGLNCGTVIGSSMAEPITEKMGTKKAMILASFIYAVALMYLVANPTVWSCYVVVVLFAIADSFGLSAQSVYFSSLDEVKRVGQSKALGVNSTVEAATSACGSLIFGAALMLGTQKGIFIIGTVFAVLLIIFVIGDRKKGKL